jgi:hypothetical protein
MKLLVHYNKRSCNVVYIPIFGLKHSPIIEVHDIAATIRDVILILSNDTRCHTYSEPLFTRW